MILHIAGIVHDDLKGRVTLHGWLKKLAAKKECAPAFAGVEYDSRAFDEIRRQRSMLGRMLREAFSERFSHDLLDAVEHCLGYEGDTHTEVFPDIETLWLNEGNYRSLSGYAETRFVRYRELLNRLLQTTDTLTALTRLSEWAWQERRVAENDPNRDSSWVRLIRERIDREPVEWAIIIVGGAHVSPNYPGNMVSLLRAEAYWCEVAFMAPTGPSPDEPAQGPVFRFG